MSRTTAATLRSLRARSIHYFLTLYEMQNITRAAERLCITQPALSNNLKALEDQLGVPLFERTPQGLFATPFADALFKRAQNAEVELGLAVDEMEQIRDSGVGVVRAGFGASVISACADILPDFMKAHPRVDVGLSEGPADMLIDQVSTGELDFAVCTTTTTPPHPDLAFTPVARLATVATVRAEHPLAGRRVTLSELSRYPWIVADKSLEASTADLLMLLKDHLSETIVSSNSPTLMRMALRTSDFVGFMPGTIITNESVGVHLVALDLEGGLYERNLVVITRKRSFLPTASDLFLRTLLRSVQPITMKETVRSKSGGFGLPSGPPSLLFPPILMHLTPEFAVGFGAVSPTEQWAICAAFRRRESDRSLR